MRNVFRFVWYYYTFHCSNDILSNHDIHPENWNISCSNCGINFRYFIWPYVLYNTSNTFCNFIFFNFLVAQRRCKKHSSTNTSGGAASFIFTFPLLAINYFLHESGFYLFFINILILLLAIILGAILLPITIFILDAINTKLKINLYTNSKKRLNESR